MKTWLAAAFEYVTIREHEKNPDNDFGTEYYYILGEKQKAYQEKVKEVENY